MVGRELIMASLRAESGKPVLRPDSGPRPESLADSLPVLDHITAHHHYNQREKMSENPLINHIMKSTSTRMLSKMLVIYPFELLAESLAEPLAEFLAEFILVESIGCHSSIT